MPFDLQPVLNNDLVQLQPIQETDFKELYAVASDPLLWEQHPNQDRYKEEVFRRFFDEAIRSKSAFVILDRRTEKIIGSTRYYKYRPENKSVVIGYTFLSRKHWGGIYNHTVKSLMLNHAFLWLNEVIFEIGATNIRSQKAIEKIGAIKTDTIEKDFPGESNKINFIYRITKKEWESIFSLTKETKR